MGAFGPPNSVFTHPGCPELTFILTAKGNKVLSKVFPHWSKAQDQVKKILGEELDSFKKNLKNINTNLM